MSDGVCPQGFPAAPIVRDYSHLPVADIPTRDKVPETLVEQFAQLTKFVVSAAFEFALEDELGLAFARLVSGHAEHGSSLFTMSDEDLARNLAEEFADAVVYRAEQLRREASR